MKRAETCSWSLCNKLHISLPPYSCVRQVYTLQSSLVITSVWTSEERTRESGSHCSWQWPGHEYELVMHVKGGSFMSISLYCVLNLLGRSFSRSTRNPIHLSASQGISKYRVSNFTHKIQGGSLKQSYAPPPLPTSPSRSFTSLFV